MDKHVSNMPHAKAFERGLTSQLGEDRAREIVAHAGERYDDLYARREHYEHGSLRQHLEGGILPGVALYRTLLAECETQEEAMSLTGVVFQEWAAEDRKRMERLARLPGYYWILRATISSIMRHTFPEEGWQREWLEKSGNAVAFNMKSCFYQDVLERYGVPELTELYCKSDDLIYEDLSPKVRWARTRTLGRGDDCCDFRFERVRRPPSTPVM